MEKPCLFAAFLLEQGQIYSVSHYLVAFGVEVEPVILKQIGRVHAVRVIGRCHHAVKINHAVKDAAAADPLIELLPSGLVIL